MNADALIVLLLPDGQVSVQDQFSPGYGRPNIDLQQNVGEVSSGHSSVDGSSLWSVNFSRPLYTADAQDADLRECQHFLFMHSPNPLVPASGELRKHVETPIISASKARKNGELGQLVQLLVLPNVSANDESSFDGMAYCNYIYCVELTVEFMIAIFFLFRSALETATSRSRRRPALPTLTMKRFR
jgi:hypothetical protein